MSYIPPDMPSDGCTFPGILKVFRKLLGADRYKEYCREHDFLRRYGIIKWYKANWLLAKRIASSNIVGILRSPIYFIFTTVTYPFYSKTQPLPKEWEGYANYYRN